MIQVFRVLHAAPEGERPHDPRTLIDHTVVAPVPRSCLPTSSGRTRTASARSPR